MTECSHCVCVSLPIERCFWQLFPAAACRTGHHCDAILSSKHLSHSKTASFYAKGADIRRLTWPRLITTPFVKRCLGDILSDKMAISIRDFTGFWPPSALAWVGGIYFTGERAWWNEGAHICKSEIKLTFFFSLQDILPEIRKKFAPALIGRERLNRLELEQTVVGVPSIFHSDEDGAGEAIGGGGGVWWHRRGGGGSIWGCAKPKIKMTAMTRLNAEQIYPTDASCKLKSPCTVGSICVCVWVCARVCVCLM